jgi:hypothetical protein
MLVHSASPPEDYTKFTGLVKAMLLRRLSSADGSRFAMVCLDALVKDNKLTDLLFDKSDPVQGP